MKADQLALVQFLPPDQEQVNPHQMRQLNGCLVHKQGRRHKIISTVTSDFGDFSVGGESQYCPQCSPHTGKEKRVNRQFIQGPI